MVNAGDITSYRDMCNAENVETLQRGMNYRLGSNHSVLLMSTRVNAPYEDEVQDDGKILIYEGHDIPKSAEITDPKLEDQPMHTKHGKLTQNGQFYEAAIAYKTKQRSAEIVRVYEKIQTGIWVYNGVFSLTDAWLENVNGRKVFKFRLETIDEDMIINDQTQQSGTLDHTRMIPSAVKIKVWQRDKGQCVKCGSSQNLHYDHIIPYSRGVTSLSEKNIQLLCMSCNLTKSDKIE